MAEKLGSILRRTHWFLAVKALAFGAGWLLFGWWWFLALSLYLYLIPAFKPFKLGVPFLLTLVFSVLAEKNLWMAIYLAVLFYLILGIKDLLLINRRAAYETLIFLLLFLTLFNFYGSFDDWLGWGVIFWSLASVLVFFVLSRWFVGYSEFLDNAEVGDQVSRKVFLTLGLISLLVWQLMWVLLFLPLSALYQTSLVFLAAVIFFELALSYLKGQPLTKKAMLSFSIFFVLLVFVLASSSWEL